MTIMLMDKKSNRTGRQGTIINRILVRHGDVLRQVQGTADDIDTASSIVQNIRSELDELKKLDAGTLSDVVDRVDALYKDVIAIAKKSKSESQSKSLSKKIDELKGALAQLASA